nr:MAG TPA: hypothetical protein [Caudoviricetes sp.]
MIGKKPLYKAYIKPYVGVFAYKSKTERKIRL